MGLLCVRFVTARIFILQEHHFIQKCWKTWKCYNKCCYWNSYLEKSCVALMLSKNYWMKCHLVLLFLFCYFSFALQTVYLELMKGCVLYRRWTYFLGLSNDMQNDFTLKQNYQKNKTKKEPVWFSQKWRLLLQLQTLECEINFDDYLQVFI